MAERKHIQHYHSVNSGSVPSIDELKTGELALNVADEKIFFKNSNNELVTISKGGVIKTTYNELLELRNNSGLTPGQEYQITDYQCTTIQPGTSAATNQFDIIVVANDVNVLSEEARATHHEGDTYFANQNLGAWKLWYSMDRGNYAWVDNEEYRVTYKGSTELEGIISPLTLCSSTNIYERFGLALPTNENGDTLYPYEHLPESYIYTTSSALTLDETYEFYAIIINDDATVSVVNITEEGVVINLSEIIDNQNMEFKGVVYRMIDENGNDCPYDFKNIMYLVGNGVVTVQAGTASRVEDKFKLIFNIKIPATYMYMGIPYGSLAIGLTESYYTFNKVDTQGASFPIFDSEDRNNKIGAYTNYKGKEALSFNSFNFYGVWAGFSGNKNNVLEKNCIGNFITGSKGNVLGLKNEGIIISDSINCIYGSQNINTMAFWQTYTNVGNGNIGCECSTNYCIIGNNNISCAFSGTTETIIGDHNSNCKLQHLKNSSIGDFNMNIDLRNHGKSCLRLGNGVENLKSTNADAFNKGYITTITDGVKNFDADLYYFIRDNNIQSDIMISQTSDGEIIWYNIPDLISGPIICGTF